MKGRKGCYGTGGKIRDLGGVRAPEYGSNKNVMREAKGETTGIYRADGGAVRGRIDRVSRKAKVEDDDQDDDDDGAAYRNGGPLTAKTRNALPTKDFALPAKRGYPINNANHARNALSRVSQFGDSEEKAKVRAAVKRKYPSIGKDD